MDNEFTSDLSDAIGATIEHRYLIIGSGRTAKHFQHYFRLKEIPFLNWNRQEHSASDLTEALNQVHVVLLLISDSAIAEFYKRYLHPFRGKVVHFSGALEIDGMASAHPLMTFGPKLYELELYEKMHFACSSKGAFRNFFPMLQNPLFELPVEQKALYHALCVMSGNFAQVLWSQCLPTFEALGVPLQALGLYWNQGLQNFLQDPSQSLTGPLARRDWETVHKHTDVLPESLQSLYMTFVRIHLAHFAKLSGAANLSPESSLPSPPFPKNPTEFSDLKEPLHPGGSDETNP